MASVAELAPRMLAYLDRVGPTLRRIGRVVRLWSIVGAIAALINIALLLAAAWPPSGGAVVLMVVIVLIFGWAPVVLFSYAAAMSSVAELPNWIRSSPQLFQQNSTQLAKVYTETVGTWGEDRKLGAIGSGAWRAGKVAWSVSKELPEFAMATRVVNPGVVGAAVIAVVWIAVTVLLVPVVALVSLLSLGS